MICFKMKTQSLQFQTNFSMIEDFPVEYNPMLMVGILHGLARLIAQVDDAQAPVSKKEWGRVMAFQEKALVILFGVPLPIGSRLGRTQ
jgi:hypothetical protein